MRCYLRILHISFKDHITNEEVRAKIQQTIGSHDFLTILKRLKLKWYGHDSRSSSLAKTILQGTVKGGRIQGRQRKRLEDNIKKWTGLEFAKSQTAVENRGKWRKLVAKSYVVRQRPSWLRDRWDEIRCLGKLVCVKVVWMLSSLSLIAWVFLFLTHGHEDVLNVEWILFTRLTCCRNLNDRPCSPNQSACAD